MRILAVIAPLAIMSVSLPATFFSEAFTASRDRRRPGGCHWALTKVRRPRSIATRMTSPPPRQQPGSVQAGAKAFAAHGCVNCHGGAGRHLGQISEGLHPIPPDLKEVVDHRTPAQCSGWSRTAPT